MFINPEIAKARLNDPGNVVNRLLEIGLGKLPSSAPARDEDEAPISGDNPIGDTKEVEPSSAAGSDSEPRPLIRLGRNRTSPVVEAGKSIVVPDRHRHGRTKGATELDDMTKEIAGTLTRLSGPAAVAEAFEIAPSTAHHLGKADGKKSGDIREKLEKNLGRVRDVALDRLLSSINLIEDDKLEGLGAKDLSTVASNLSRVVEKTLPKEMQQAPTAQLIVYAPTIAKEEHYETVVLQG